jgi:hypothetical protein
MKAVVLSFLSTVPITKADGSVEKGSANTYKINPSRAVNGQVAFLRLRGCSSALLDS